MQIKALVELSAQVASKSLLLKDNTTIKEEIHMILPIDDNWRIKADSYSWAIQKKGQKKDKETGEKVDKWVSKCWYTTPEAAIRELGRLLVRTSDAQTLAEALVEVDRVSATLTQALALDFEVKRI